MKTRRSSVLCLAVALVIGLMMPHTTALAQNYPSKPITLYIGYAPGGQADALARAVAKRLEEALKIPVVVENRSGANGMIAAQAAAKAPPDGHTLLLVTDAMMSIDAHLQGASKFDINAAVEPLVNLVFSPLFLAANRDVPADTIASLVDFGRQNPRTLSYGTSGTATPHRLAGELLQLRGKFEMLHVPYKGTAASISDLLGGQITLVFGAATAMKPLAEAGKIKILGVTSAKRFPSMADVPAIAETFEGFDLVSYLGLVVPKGTAEAQTSLLNKELNRILSNPAMRNWIDSQGMIPAGGSAADFAAQIKTDHAARGDLIRNVGLRPE